MSQTSHLYLYHHGGLYIGHPRVFKNLFQGSYEHFLLKTIINDMSYFHIKIIFIVLIQACHHTLIQEYHHMLIQTLNHTLIQVLHHTLFVCVYISLLILFMHLMYKCWNPFYKHHLTQHRVSPHYLHSTIGYHQWVHLHDCQCHHLFYPIYYKSRRQT